MIKRWHKTMKLFSLCLILCLAAGCSLSEPADSNPLQDGGNPEEEKVRVLSMEKENIFHQGWSDDGEYLDVQVRRADSVAVSLLSDSFSDYGKIEDFRVLHGTTLDSRTGQKSQQQTISSCQKEALSQTLFA